MATAGLSREEKVAAAKRLRGDGLTYKEIGERLDVSITTVCEYVTRRVTAWKRKNAAKLREQNLARNEEKRAWERAKATPCSQCGGLSNYRSELCQACVQTKRKRAGRERTERFIALRNQGLRNVEIAEREQVAPHVVTTTFHRAHRYGLDAGRSPYFKAAA
jgi:transposase